MSVNMLVFTWISSFSSLKCPDIIHGLMQFVSNEICIVWSAESGLSVARMCSVTCYLYCMCDTASAVCSDHF